MDINSKTGMLWSYDLGPTVFWYAPDYKQMDRLNFKTV